VIHQLQSALEAAGRKHLCSGTVKKCLEIKGDQGLVLDYEDRPLSQ
jgi:hypothetical protein